MFSRSYEFRSAAILEGSKTIGRQVNRTIGKKGKGEVGGRERSAGVECGAPPGARYTRVNLRDTPMNVQNKCKRLLYSELSVCVLKYVRV